MSKTFLFYIILTDFEMKRLQLKCKPLDDLLGGGIESNTITEVYGEAGSGKTNLCLQASRECVASGKKVAYIDTESVSIERIGQICKGYDYKKMLSNILFFAPTSFEEQEKMIYNAIKVDDVGLIVVDTFNMFYRIKIEDDEEGANRSLNRQMTNLQLAARKKDLYEKTKFFMPKKTISLAKRIKEIHEKILAIFQKQENRFCSSRNWFRRQAGRNQRNRAACAYHYPYQL
jgi:KaiC/GvpD/RAD55 family RecA-like ATPase